MRWLSYRHLEMWLSFAVFVVFLRVPPAVLSQNVIVEAGDFSSLVYLPSTASWNYNSNPRPGPNGTSVQDYYHGGGSYTSKVNGASVSLTFNGSYIAYYSDLFNSHGNIQINLDGLESTISTYSPLPYGTPQVKIFEAQVDPYAAHHTIKLTNLEAKTIGLDYFLFTPASEFLSRASSPSQASSGPARSTPDSGLQAPSDTAPQETSGSSASVPNDVGSQTPSGTADAAPASDSEVVNEPEHGSAHPDLAPSTPTITQQHSDSESSSAPSEESAPVHTTETATPTLSIKPGTPSRLPPGSHSNAAIIIAVVSALAVLAVLLSCLFWFCRRRHYARKVIAPDAEEAEGQASFGTTVPYLLHSSPSSSILIEKDVVFSSGKALRASSRFVPLDHSHCTPATSAELNNASVDAAELGAPPLYADSRNA